MGTVVLLGRDGHGTAEHWRRELAARELEALWIAPPGDDGDPDRVLALDQPVVVLSALEAAMSIRALVGVVPLDAAGATTATFLTERFGLRGPVRAEVVRCVDRVACRRAWFDRGVPHAEYRVLQREDDPTHVARQVGLPAVVRPSRREHDGYSRRVDDAERAPEVLDLVRADLDAVGSGAEPAMIERLVGGRAIGVVLVLDGGAPVWSEFYEVEESPSVSAPDGIRPPAELDAGDRIEIDRVVTDAVAAVGLTTGPLQVLVSLRKRFVRVLDMIPAIESGPLAHLLERGADPVPAILDVVAG